MSTRKARRIQRTSTSGLDAVGQPVETSAIRRSSRLKTAKGTFGEAAARVSPPNTQDAGLAADLDPSHGRNSNTIVSKKYGEAIDDIIYTIDTDMQQYIRVTIRGHPMEENSVFLVCYRKILDSNSSLLVVL